MGRARSVSSERDFTQVGSGLANKHLTWLEKLARDKHSSLLQKLVNYDRKSFITLGPGCILKVTEIKPTCQVSMKYHEP
jgi:hypothetical protein